MYIQSFGGTNFDVVRLNANNYLNMQSAFNIVDIQENKIYCQISKQLNFVITLWIDI